MEIGSGKPYPASSLSNFAGHRFEFDGVEIYSMEGFLQSLKFKNVEMQKEVCKLIGMAAKRKGAKKNWKSRQILYWNEKEYKRSGDEYQQLLTNVYLAMFNQSDSFRKALIDSKNASFTHSIGKRNKNETVLTIQEFISRLNYLRKLL
jgi:predicted NAD-dependent protein-ADP-ribosyltransferase YbiA (DUF1768 family)